MDLPLYRPPPPPQHRSRLLSAPDSACRRHDREQRAFESDLRAALERDRRRLRRASNEREGLILGRGTVDARVRVVGEPDTIVHENLPLVVHPPGQIRVHAPPALADVVIDSLLARARDGWTGGTLEIDDVVTREGRRATVTSWSKNLWVILRGSWAPPARHDATDLWFAPDGSACVRSPGQAGGSWVSIDPLVT